MSDTTADPKHRPAQDAQEDQAPERASPKETGVLLSRADGKTDVVSVKYPSLPIRFAIYQQFRYAIGYRGDEDEPSAEFNEADANAILWAALGVCWAGRDAGLPDFRDCQRNAVEYGEAVMTALYFAGYVNAADLANAGNALMQDFIREVLEARRRAEAGFQGAKRRAR